MSGSVSVKKRIKKSVFPRKGAKMSYWCYFPAKKIISMEKKIHDPFINPYRPRPIYIYGLPRRKIPLVGMRSYICFPKSTFAA